MAWELPTLVERSNAMPLSARSPAWIGNRTATTGPPPLELLPMTEVLQARILVVDDMHANARLLQRMLMAARYARVEITIDPFAVYELHCQNHYDLILLDLDM